MVALGCHGGIISFNYVGVKKGFTLIELLVVIAIIGILASVVLNALLNEGRNEGGVKICSNSKCFITKERYFLDDGCVKIPDKGVVMCGEIIITKIEK